jgi:hypothetical protein
MNDPTFVEASRKFAERIMIEAPKSDSAALRWGFRQVLSRNPKPAEVSVIAKVLNRQRGVYRGSRAAALKLLRVGESLYNDKLDPSELAAWTQVASVLLNLDEAITKG